MPSHASASSRPSSRARAPSPWRRTSPRGREIAALAAGGMTSRAIAARLTLSVRTVDSHLARVFTKTGVHSREGLIAVLR